VTAVEAPCYLAFAGALGCSVACWGMELEPMGDRQTEAKSDRELAAIKSVTPGDSDS
jgi:hypothetical protein